MLFLIKHQKPRLSVLAQINHSFFGTKKATITMMIAFSAYFTIFMALHGNIPMHKN
jgi:hypothetical protein